MSTGQRGTVQVSEVHQQLPVQDIRMLLMQVSDSRPDVLYDIDEDSPDFPLLQEILIALPAHLRNLSEDIIKVEEIELVKDICSGRFSDKIRPGLGFIATMILLGYDSEEIYQKFLYHIGIRENDNAACWILYLYRNIRKRTKEKSDSNSEKSTSSNRFYH